MERKIPKFPEFRPFSIDDIDWYYNFYIDRGLDPYADLNPENLFVWLNMNNDLAVSNLDGVLILKYTNPLNKNQLNLIPLAESLTDLTIEKVIKYLEDNNLPAILSEIPSKLCVNLNQDKWLIEDDRNGFEYVLDTTQQSLLDGKEFSRQRRRINFFEREHAQETIAVNYYPKFNDEIRDAFVHHLDTMPLNSNDEASQQNMLEPIAIKRNLDNAQNFHKKGLMIKFNNKIVSLTMISFLDNKTAAINHLKVDYSIQYMFQYTIYQLAKILREKGIREMNLEQDLGIDGLRIFKERLRPSRMLEKKSITRR